MERIETKNNRECEVWEHEGKELRIFPGDECVGLPRSTVVIGPFSVAEITDLLNMRMETVTKLMRRRTIPRPVQTELLESAE